MKKRVFVFLIVGVMLYGLMVPPAQAITVVYDHFDDGVLDPAWSITFQDNATGWTYVESGTNLEVTDIVPIVVHTSSALLLIN